MNQKKINNEPYNKPLYRIKKENTQLIIEELEEEAFKIFEEENNYE